MENTENEVTVKAVKTFHGAEGFMTPDSEAFTVSRQRFADLKANSLVKEYDAEAQAAEESAAKEAAKPNNKAAKTPENK